jgi:putative peptide maturation dehydrogenase
VSRVCRAPFVFVRLEETELLEVGALLRGGTKLSPASRLVALSVLTGDESPLTPEELERLLAFPESEWADRPADDPVVDSLLERGLLLTDEDDPQLERLRRLGEQLESTQWHRHATLFHAMTRWRGVEVPELPERAELLPAPPEEYAAQFVAEFGPPPPHFYELEEPALVIDLPFDRHDTGLYATLRRRRTTRAFDPEAQLPSEQLATILDTVFGCYGTTELQGDSLALKKTSPSAGSLHPIEVYPLLLRIAGIEPGLYHYRTRDHALERVEALDDEEASSLATRFVAGQTYFAGAQALFLLTARFYRSFWKYRRHERAYSTLLLDAGHLSQTLYLVAAELGLGAFVTAAINGADIEERLGLDPVVEGAIAVCGAGVRAAGRSELEPEYEPYEPR